LARSKTIFVLPDAHIPHQDPKAWRCAIKLLGELQPDEVVIIGDFADLESLSHHVKNRPELTKLKGEYEVCNGALDQVQMAAPGAHWTYIEGNHEYRAVKHTNTVVPHLDGLLDVPAALNLEQRHISWVPMRKSLRRAWVSPWGVGYMHAADSNGRTRPGKHHAAMHANLVGPASHCPVVVYGHHHSFQSYRSSAGYEAHCCGFLGDFDADDTAFDYNSGPTPWVIGVLLQRVDRGLVTTTQVPIYQGRHSLY